MLSTLFPLSWGARRKTNGIAEEENAARRVHGGGRKPAAGTGKSALQTSSAGAIQRFGYCVMDLGNVLEQRRIERFQVVVRLALELLQFGCFFGS